MRTKHYFLAIIALLIIAGCSFNKEEEKDQAIETNKAIATDLTSGIDEVVNSLEKLQSIVAESPKQVKTIQATGKKLDENWDRIEKLVEEQYPKDYVNIEQSLYPLIFEVKKEQQDLKRIEQLTNDTTKKITEFKNKISITSP